ncbi:hypothetical protein [Roseospira visakhapatnamensis]|uniref:Uncharacterized protein n=1 Tax=Roseospira visakhapatnamensis TaxID=390880 RepID=A0A7W6RDF1_9PROT|nr:hypothetical protein [Roseospira visakhapatnamensis]MBB4266277.1 hypothetical protein [Roseospira visakhapatnamensis]
MTAVKTLVTVMTLMLLVGLGLLAYGMSQQSSQLGRTEGDGARPAMAAAPTPFGTLALDEPTGSGVAAVVMDGQGRALMTVTGGGRPDRVVVVDLIAGRRLGVISLGERSAYEPSASR